MQMNCVENLATEVCLEVKDSETKSPVQQTNIAKGRLAGISKKPVAG